MKQRLYAIVVLALFIFAIYNLNGCEHNNTIQKAQPPLQETGKEYLPPGGCQELRERGGSC